MKKYVVVGFYKHNGKGYKLGIYESIERANLEITDEFMLDPEIDVDYYVIMTEEEATEYTYY